MSANEAARAAPFCPVHKALEDRDGLVLEVGNDCVACSLHERSQLLTMLEPFASADGSDDSLTVLRRVIDGEPMRSLCIEKVREKIADLSRTSIAAGQNALELRTLHALHNELESLSIQEQKP